MSFKQIHAIKQLTAGLKEKLLIFRRVSWATIRSNYAIREVSVENVAETCHKSQF